jgi:predicted RNA-binding Zn-ribbon protein involved in translation (DUF1610 family)
MNDFVVRLHRALLETLQQRSARLDQPVTVAEIYQDLIPYRLVRSFGFALNADYEFALLQMLAGEGNLARIEPPEVREELRLELLSPNPNVGMFRQYAACDVFVMGENGAQPSAPARAPDTGKPDGAAAKPVVPHDWLLIEEQRTAAGQPAAPRAATDKPQKDVATPTPPTPSSAPAPARPVPVAQVKPEPVKAKTAEVQSEAPAKPSAQVKPQSASPAGAGVSCSACGHALPGGRSVRFCPSCGKEQRGKCTNCGEDLEPAWRFCVACGTAA